MTPIAALWPFGILGALALLGRGRSTLDAAARRLRAGADGGAVRARPEEAVHLRGALLLRGCSAGDPASRAARDRLGEARRGGGRADDRPGRADGSRQPPTSSSTSPTRATYDFSGALAEIRHTAKPGDVVIYTPQYLDTVIAYYGVGPARASGRQRDPEASQRRSRLPAGELPGQAAVPPAGRADAAEAAPRGPPAHHHLAPPADPRLGALPMNHPATDPRLLPPRWSAATPGRRHRMRLRFGVAVACRWRSSTSPGCSIRRGSATRSSTALLIAAELFNLLQAIGFWWTCASERRRGRRSAWPTTERRRRRADPDATTSRSTIVEPTVAAAMRLRGARVHVWLLDDGDREEMRALAARQGARYVRAQRPQGAKAGNINHALRRTRRAVRRRARLRPRARSERFLRGDARPLVRRPDVAFVQTPQYYANAGDRRRSRPRRGASRRCSSGAIARGKDGHGAMFCCGTNVVFRRAALEDVGGFPEDSLTEDFELSVQLHERGWRSAMCPRCSPGARSRGHGVLRQPAAPLGAGCLGAIRSVAARAAAAAACKLQYLLSCVVLPVGLDGPGVHDVPGDPDPHGRQPLAGAVADQFLLHFARTSASR